MASACYGADDVRAGEPNRLFEKLPISFNLSSWFMSIEERGTKLSTMYPPTTQSATGALIIERHSTDELRLEHNLGHERKFTEQK